MKRHASLTLILLSVIALTTISFAQDTMTITTYYPAPYGEYVELRTQSNAFLAITSGNVGIGTTTPGANYKLEVVGGPVKTTGGLIIQVTAGTPSYLEAGRMWLQ